MKSLELKEIILIAILAALSIVTKPLVTNLSAVMVGSFGIPNGVVGGIIYMMWLSLIFRLVSKPFVVLGFTVLQGILAIMIMGMPPLGLVSYVASGIGGEMVLFPLRKKHQLFVNMLAGAVANSVGAVAVYFLFFSKNVDPLPLVVTLSFFSGSLSGILTTGIYSRLKNHWQTA
ncbi:MAG: hypothetical protein AVO33_03530 [delta proteobacterium ML8_F1]|nr:MAG: hypothetical protein AVO33_03530 [delta proteobacterium ML8_F1]